MDFWDVFFLFLVYIPITILWIATIFDCVGRIDLSGIAKLLWVAFIIILPVIGALTYVLMRPSAMELDVRRDEKMAALYKRSADAEARAGQAVPNNPGSIAPQ